MTYFQGSDDNFWLVVSFIVAGLMSSAIWYVVIVGRDRPRQRQRRGESTIINYGDIGEDHAPVPKFLLYAIIGTAIWALFYLLWAGINGPTGYR